MTAVSTSRVIRAPRQRVWEVFTDMASAVDRIPGIDSIELLGPAQFDEGFRWRETRTIFGKAASEEMWITRVEPGVLYEAEADSHGTHYRTRYRFESVDGGTEVFCDFSGTPHSTVARVMGLLTGPLARRSVTSMLRADMDALAVFLESEPTAESAGE